MQSVFIGSGILANLITTSRIAIIPWTVRAIAHQQWGIVCGLFAYGAFSDFADGFCARRFSKPSKFGALFDPIADKLFILSIFIAFVVNNNDPLLPWSYVLFLCFRETCLIVGGIVLSVWAKNRVTSPILDPSIWGKLTTAFQMIYFLSICLIRFIPQWYAIDTVWHEHILSRFFLPPLVLLSVYSFLWYGKRAMGFIKQS